MTMLMPFYHCPCRHRPLTRDDAHRPLQTSTEPHRRPLTGTTVHHGNPLSFTTVVSIPVVHDTSSRHLLTNGLVLDCSCLIILSKSSQPAQHIQTFSFFKRLIKNM